MSRRCEKSVRVLVLVLVVTTAVEDLVTKVTVVVVNGGDSSRLSTDYRYI